LFSQKKKIIPRHALSATLRNISWKFYLCNYCIIPISPLPMEQWTEHAPPKLVYWFDPWSGHTEDFKNGTSGFSSLMHRVNDGWVQGKPHTCSCRYFTANLAFTRKKAAWPLELNKKRWALAHHYKKQYWSDWSECIIHVLDVTLMLKHSTIR